MIAKDPESVLRRLTLESLNKVHLCASLADSILRSNYNSDCVRVLSRHWLLKDYLQPSLLWRGSNQTIGVV